MGKFTIEDMKKIAIDRGGKCLSDKFINTRTPLLWRCNQGHTWPAKPKKVLYEKTWCKLCFIAKLRGYSIEDMNKLAKQHNGKCLSLEYKSRRDKLRWCCAIGHLWAAMPSNIIKGQWCPECANRQRGESKLGTIGHMKKLALKKMGSCLSDDYTNSRTPLRWRCVKGHVWLARPASVSVGHWCPICKSSIRENICRRYFEIMFNDTFPKSRPSWLVNSNGNHQELDGHSLKLKLAFEYNGQQHYNGLKNGFFRARTLAEQMDVDENKRRLCKINNVTLIEIPYIVKDKDIGRYIIQRCEELEVAIPNSNLDGIRYQDFDICNKKELDLTKKIANNRGGECLSKNYIDARTKLGYRCNFGHVWAASPLKIKNGTWCPICAGTVRKTIEEIQELAKKRGGLCLSTTYVNNDTKIEWECRNGHRWFATPHNVKKGQWCMICAGRRGSIQEMAQIAISRSGICLSEKYECGDKKLKWRCKFGHEWLATPTSIKSGAWCLECHLNKKRSTVGDMEKLAEERGGFCLSDKYKNFYTKIKWMCESKHVWMATPASIKYSNSWCPFCKQTKQTI